MSPTTTRQAEPDQACADAVDLAREAAEADAGPGQVGPHIGLEVESERVVTHLFGCLSPGYVGWRWAVTVARAARSKVVTVSEGVLLPGPGSLLAPDWVPWTERVRPGDLKAGDLMPARPDDERLVPAVAIAGEAGLLDWDEDDAWRLAIDVTAGSAAELAQPGTGTGAGRAESGADQAESGTGQAEAGMGQAGTGAGQAEAGTGRAKSGAGQAKPGADQAEAEAGQAATVPDAAGTAAERGQVGAAAGSDQPRTASGTGSAAASGTGSAAAPGTGSRGRSRRRSGSARVRDRDPGVLRPARVLSATGRDEAALRWYTGEQGPRSTLASAAPAHCLTCGFLVRLSGPLGRVFGVCANEFAPDDGKVVSADHGCGAHSDANGTETAGPAVVTPAIDEMGYDMLNTGATVPDSVLETLDHEQL